MLRLAGVSWPTRLERILLVWAGCYHSWLLLREIGLIEAAALFCQNQVPRESTVCGEHSYRHPRYAIWIQALPYVVVLPGDTDIVSREVRRPVVVRAALVRL